LNTSTFIYKILIDLFFYEFIWVFVKRGTYKIKTLQFLMKFLIGLNIFFLITIGSIHNFVNLYFMTMWYFVIYPDRILNELTEEKIENET